jgi:hypothetical protein
MFGFVNRYVTLAGRSCCAGRSWVGLDRSLKRRGGGPSPGACRAPDLYGADAPDQFLVSAAPEAEPAHGAASSSAPTQR